MLKEIKIGYLIPEFPGQTHIFFWRERNALKEKGIDTEILSTRKPLRRLMSHRWSKEAIKNTTFLFPISIKAAVWSIIYLFKAGPVKWFIIIKTIFNSDQKDFKNYMKLFALLLMGAQLSWLGKIKSFTHIHVHSCADAALITMFASLLSDISYSMTLHGPLSSYGNDQKLKWQYASFCILITKRLFNEVKYVLKDTLPQKLAIAPMGVDLNSFHRTKPYVPWAKNGSAKIFCCSRLSWRKGYRELLDALVLLRNKGIDFRVNIAGEDHSSDKQVRTGLNSMIEHLDLGNCVNLLGAVSEETVRSELESSHLFVLPSWNEELGVATMEAMAMEVPVVVTDVGGVPELVENGIDGIMTHPKNPEGLADSILKILNDPSMAARLSKAGYRKVKERFNSNISAETMVKLLRGEEILQ